MTQSVLANLDEARMRIGGALRNLVERKRLEADGRETAVVSCWAGSTTVREPM